MRKYLRKIVHNLWDLRREDREQDVIHIVPLEVITSNKEFLSYITGCNNRLGHRQVRGLLKLAAFCRNPTLVEARQENLRSKCLAFWNIPDNPKANIPKFSVEILKKFIRNPEFMLVQAKTIKSREEADTYCKNIRDWQLVPMFSEDPTNSCSFFAGIV